jgi:hypothetical protein
MHPFVHDPALGREAVFVPSLLDVNQSALPRTEKQMLKGRNWGKLRLGKHA